MPRHRGEIFLSRPGHPDAGIHQRKLYGQPGEPLLFLQARAVRGIDAAGAGGKFRGDCLRRKRERQNLARMSLDHGWLDNSLPNLANC